MPTFAGIDHTSLTVTDLDRSEAFYTEVLDFLRLADFGHVRVLIETASGFFLSLKRHPAGTGKPFTELNTGLDHLGLRATTRHELEEWTDRFEAAGVTYTPIQEATFGLHLNFRDPDNIPLEFYVPSAAVIDAFAELREHQPTRDEIDARVQQALNAAAPTPPERGSR